MLKNELKHLHCYLSVNFQPPKFISTELIISSGMFKIVIFTNYVFACTKSTHHLIHFFSNEFCVNFDIVYTIPPRSSMITLRQTCQRIRKIYTYCTHKKLTDQMLFMICKQDQKFPQSKYHSQAASDLSSKRCNFEQAKTFHASPALNRTVHDEMHYFSFAIQAPALPIN